MKLVPDEMADDLPIRKPTGPTGKRKKRMQTSRKPLTEFEQLYRDVMEDGYPLPAWAKQYAVWLSGMGNRRMSNTEHERAVRGFSGYHIQMKVLIKLRGRKDFKEFQQSVDADVVERAKQSLIHDYPRYVAMHKEAAEGLMAAGKEDPTMYGKIAALTAPILDRVSPKKEERQTTQGVVVIHLGTGDSMAAKLLKAVTPAEDVVEVEWEEITETDPLPPAA